MSFNGTGPKRVVPAPTPKQHVIEQYTHRRQLVQCVCGWRGSSATDGTAGSDWSRHLAEFRTTKR